MIRINLLPIKQKKKQIVGQQQIFLGLVVILLVAAGLYSLNDGEQSKIKGMQDTVTSHKADLDKLKDLIGDAKEVEKKKEELQKKLEVISSLKDSKIGPVRMLDELSLIIPNRLWLKTFSVNGESIKMNGTAISNKDIAVFMRNLETSPYFTNVVLTEVKAVQATKLAAESYDQLMEFGLTMKYVKPKS